MISYASPADDALAQPSVILFFDFFFGDNAGVPAENFRLFFQWTVTGGSVDLVGGIGPGVFGAPPDEPNGRYVDLGGSTGDPGRFETIAAFPVLAGQTYNLSFDFRSTGGDFNTATVTVGDKVFTVSTSSTDFTHFSANFTFDQATSIRITFQGDENDRDNSGIGIDGVLFGPVTGSPTPTTGGADLLIGGPGADFLAGGAGNDTLLGAGGDDTLTGGSGDDLLDGQVGADTADYGDSTTGVAVSLALSGAQATGFGSDTLISIENLRGSAFADVLTGDELNNILLGLAGDDRLFGAGGADQLAGGAGRDTLVGGAGDDALFGQEGADALNGGLGADRLFGGTDADSLIGEDGADLLNGEAGDDTLDGGIGDDVLSGELGGDNLAGGDGGDVLFGGADADSLGGGAGGDVLNGEGGADTLAGGDDSDTLSGEEGADVLTGGRGADVLIGGGGADRFVFTDAANSPAAGRDLVFDFRGGEDVLDLSGVDADTLTAGDQAFRLVAQLTGRAGDLVVQFDGNTGRALVVGDTNGDGVGDFGFVVGGQPPSSAADFIL